jgi:hypothetical protein
MKIILTPLALLCLLTGTNVHAEYRVISEDYKFSSQDISIKFSPSLYKQEATVSYRICPSCQWQERIFTVGTQYSVKDQPVNFKEFKQVVKKYKYNPPSDGFRTYLSIDRRNNEIFSIEWDIVELNK